MIATTATAAPPSRPSSDILWAQLADIDDLVEAGDRRRALSKARRLLDTVDGAAARSWPTSSPRSRATATPHGRHATPASRPGGSTRGTPGSAGWSRNPRARPVADAQAARYLADQPDPVEPDRRHPDDDAAYDPEAEFAAAVEPLRGAACLGCGIERSSLDRATGDGVCESCGRPRRRPGSHAPPSDHRRPPLRRRRAPGWPASRPRPPAAAAPALRGGRPGRPPAHRRVGGLQRRPHPAGAPPPSLTVTRHRTIDHAPRLPQGGGARCARHRMVNRPAGRASPTAGRDGASHGAWRMAAPACVPPPTGARR